MMSKLIPICVLCFATLGWAQPALAEEGTTFPIEEAAEQEPLASTESNATRMANRFSVIFRLGVGGGIQSFNGIDLAFDAATTPGLTLRFEAPVHEVITIGGLWSFYSFAAFDRDRNLGMDLSPFVKGRWAFEMGKKRLEGELYGVFQFGLSLANVPDNDLAGYSTFGYGFNIAIGPGFQVFVADNIGVFFEPVYFYGWARFDGELTGTLSQATLRFGVSFALK